jgi:vacuolar-type H+-ATPase subunit H
MGLLQDVLARIRDAEAAGKDRLQAATEQVERMLEQAESARSERTGRAVAGAEEESRQMVARAIAQAELEAASLLRQAEREAGELRDLARARMSAAVALVVAKTGESHGRR